MIKLVIFDLDGTLVNAYPAVCSSVNYVLRRLGFPARSKALIKRSVGWGDRQLMAGLVGEGLADKAIALYRPHHTKALRAQGGARLLPGVLGVLKDLGSQGVLLAIASNRPTRFTRIILKTLGIIKMFKVVHCADRARRPKPYGDMLLEVCRKLGLKKSQALYVGDMGIDVHCGRRAGIRTVAVATGSSTKKELKDLKPTRVVSRINLLQSIIKELT